MTAAGGTAPAPIEVEARGLRFSGLAAGPHDGPLLLLLHGFPQTSACWRSQLGAAAEAGWRAVAPDQRGYAQGARPRGVAAYRAAELVADVVAVADALGAERFAVGGHDWGGAVAWYVAALHPDRVRALLAVSTPHPRAIGRAARTGWAQRVRSGYIPLLVAPGSEHVLGAFGGLPLRVLLRGSGLRDPEPYVRALGSADALRGPVSWYRALPSAPLRNLPRVTAPTTFVVGRRDPAFSRAAVDGTARYVAGDYRVVELDAGHWLPEEHAGDVDRALVDLLARAGDAAP